MSGKVGEGQSGGVNISGSVGSVHGDIVGRDKVVHTVSTVSSVTFDTAMRAVVEAINAAPEEKRVAAEAKLAALKQEAAKGKGANDKVVAKLLEGLVGLVPGAVKAVVSAFGTPVLGAIAGPATEYVIGQFRGE